MNIGVFDSGVGGKSVANAIKKALPEHTVIYKQDRKNVPYGSKPPEVLFQLVNPILQKMIDEDCKVIVIACNTVTTTIISKLRKQFEVPIIGIEPMVKPAAALTTSNIIAVCATPTTLASKRYAQLKQDYASAITVLEPNCSQWSTMIENDAVNHEKIAQQIKQVCMQGADVIVLGCTHYHWIELEIGDIARHFGATVMQPEPAVVKRLKQALARLG